MTHAGGPPPLRIGARRSPLARAQAERVAAALAARGLASTFVGITTRGDVDRRALAEIGGTGVFVTGVREALLEGRADVAVHSLKDLPTEPVPGLELAAVCEREDTRDVLVGCRLVDLTDGARIGTGSPRRAVQLQQLARDLGRPLTVLGVRGNVDTRLDLVRRGEVDAVVLAAAGLVRLGHLVVDGEAGTVADLPGELLPVSVMVPAPGQGALALEVTRDLNPAALAAVRALDAPSSRAETTAERAFLATLGSGCTAPVGARAVVGSAEPGDFEGTNLTLTAVVGRTRPGTAEIVVSGTNERWGESEEVLRYEAIGTVAEAGRLGRDLARQALAALETVG